MKYLEIAFICAVLDVLYSPVVRNSPPMVYVCVCVCAHARVRHLCVC